MLEELHRRTYAPSTIEYYVHHVEEFARFVKRAPDRLTPTHLRTYQAYLLRERKLAPRTVRLQVSAIRFFFVKTLRRRYVLDDTPYPKARDDCRRSRSWVACITGTNPTPTDQTRPTLTLSCPRLNARRHRVASRKARHAPRRHIDLRPCRQRNGTSLQQSVANPSRYPRTANRRRSSAVSRSRQRNCRRRIRFSSVR